MRLLRSKLVPQGLPPVVMKLLCHLLLSSFLFLSILHSAPIRVNYLLWGSGLYGDCIVIELPGPDGKLEPPDEADNKIVLLDGGYAATKASSRLDDFLDGRNITKIDFMVLSSHGADHFTGLKMVSDNYQVDNFYESSPWPRGAKSGYDALIGRLEQIGTNFFKVVSGDVLSGPLTNKGPGWDTSIKVLCLAANPAIPVSGDDDNIWSMVIKVSAGKSSFLFGGDAYTDPTEKALLENRWYAGAREELSGTDLYKVHHHGSKTSSSSEFLSVMAPKFAVTQDGGSSAHPYQLTLDRLIEKGVIIYRNDLDGTVTVRADDSGNYDITRENLFPPASVSLYRQKVYTVPPPSLPGGLTAVNYNVSSVRLVWNPNPAAEDIIRYLVFRSTVQNGDPIAGRSLKQGMSVVTGIYRLIGQTAETSYIDTNLAGGTEYFYRLSAVNRYGYERRYSNEVSVKPQSTPYVTAFSPSNNSARVRPEEGLKISFSSLPDTGYAESHLTLKALRDNSGNYITPENISGSPSWDGLTLVFTPAGLKNNHLYEAEVRFPSKNTDGNDIISVLNWRFTAVFNSSEFNMFFVRGREDSVEIFPSALEEDGYISATFDPLKTPERVNPAGLVRASQKLQTFGDPFSYIIPGSEREITAYSRTGDMLDRPFKNRARLKLFYSDTDQDGIVDWTEPPVRESSLTACFLDEKTELWVKLPDSAVDPEKNTVTASIPHFSSFALAGESEHRLSSAYAFPVPYNPKKDPRHGAITFTNLSSSARIKIFTLSGEEVKLIDFVQEYGAAPQAVWDTRNETGNLTAPGLYHYIIENSNEKKKGTLLILR